MPADFNGLTLVRSLLNQHNLALSAVNVDIKDVSHFRYGALSAPDPDARERAVRLLQERMNLAADIGIDLVFGQKGETQCRAYPADLSTAF